MQSLSGTYGLRLAAQPALALARPAAAPARVLLRGERARRGAARWTLHFAKPAPRGVGLVLAVALLGGVAVVGALRGGEYEAFAAREGGVGDYVARALGFGVAAVTISGQSQIGEREILALAGLSAKISLPFFDAVQARKNLEALPLIKQASVRKLYPDRIVIDIVERTPAALWQKDGELSAIAADGDGDRQGATTAATRRCRSWSATGANERARRVHRAARRLGRAQAEDRRRHVGRRPALEPQDALGRRGQAAGGRSAGGDGDAADAAAPVAHSRPRRSLGSTCASPGKVFARLSEEAAAARAAAAKPKKAGSP